VVFFYLKSKFSNKREKKVFSFEKKFNLVLNNNFLNVKEYLNKSVLNNLNDLEKKRECLLRLMFLKF
jgi:hypothetical protein